jgi:hypothetical protein
MKLKTPEEWAEEMGFKYIDDIEPQTITISGNNDLLKLIEKIQQNVLDSQNETK